MGRKKTSKNNHHPISNSDYDINWHVTKTLSWTFNTLVGAGVYLGLSSIPTAVASALPIANIRYQKTDKTASALMKRGGQQACQNTTQTTNWFSLGSVTATPYFSNVNGAMVTTAIGPTGTAFPGMFVNSFNDDNNPLVANTQVDANTWTAGNNVVIPTQAGPVFCYNTVTATTQAFCVPYTDSLQAAGSIQNVAYWNSYSQKNPSGAARNGGGFEVVFESNTVNGNANNYQIFLKGYQADNVTPISVQEARVSTITNSNNINSGVIVNPDNSGTVYWQQRINNINQIVKRSYNASRVFIDPAEVTLSNTTLPNYDCVSPQIVALPNGQAKLVFIGASTVGGIYNLYVQDVNLSPNFQLIGAPVNITANQGITISSADYSVMPTANNGLRIVMSAFPPSGSLKAYIMDVKANNTLTSGISLIDPNTYAQRGMTIVDRGSGRYTIGYQCGSNVCHQTYNTKPFIIRPTNITINQQAYNQTITIPGIFVEQTTYQRNQLNVTLQVDPNILKIYTSATAPTNAAVNYDASTGILSLSTRGINCLTDMNNLLCDLKCDINAYERDSSHLILTVSDDSALAAYSTSVPVAVTAQNFVPTLNNAYLYIGQGNSSRFILDISTEDNVPANSLNIFLNNLNPSAASVEYRNGTVTQQGINRYTLDKNNDVQVRHLGGNSAPQFQVSVSSYDGQQSQAINVNVFFFPKPQIIARQISYNAKSKDDRTPVVITDLNFENINSNSPTSAQIYTVIYDGNPHGGFYRKPDFDNRIEYFTQAEVDNTTHPIIYFIPDGSGEKPNIEIGFSDGYNTLPIVPIEFDYTVAPAVEPSKANNQLVTGADVIQYFIGLIVANKSAKMLADFIRHRKNPFANFVRNAGNFGYNSFDTVSGHQFTTLVDKMVTTHGITGEVKKNAMEYSFLSRYIPFYMTPQERKLIIFAKAYAEELAKHKEVDQFILARWFYRFYWGFPLNAGILNQDSNTENVSNMVTTITKRLEGDEIVVENSWLPYLRMLHCAKDKSAALEMTTFDGGKKNNLK